MKIEAVGRKRDIQIAKLKGYNVLQYGAMYTNLPMEKSDTCRTRKYWSTSRNDAWELWDELPVNWKHIVMYEWGLVDFDSDKFAPAVSNCWITWRLNE